MFPHRVPAHESYRVPITGMGKRGRCRRGRRILTYGGLVQEGGGLNLLGLALEELEAGEPVSYVGDAPCPRGKILTDCIAACMLR